MNIESMISEAYCEYHQTHYPGCWCEHHECAVAAIERMRGELSDVLQFLDGIQVASFAPGLPGHMEIRNRIAIVMTMVGDDAPEPEPCTQHNAQSEKWYGVI